MNRLTKTLAGIAATVMLAVGLSACSGVDDAEIVGENMTKAADNFEINRRIVMFNGITDQYLLVIEGACSIKDDGDQLEVLCKVSEENGGEYKKHFLGLSDNVSYFVEQGEPIKASANHYRVTFKPQSIIPDVDFRGSTEDLPTTQD